jgi:uncharacterized membrane protein YfcA
MADLLVPLWFFLAATLYSSVGHAGASAYLATMALMGFAPETMKPTALVLNMFVATITTLQFARVGAVSWRRLLPFVVGSIPAAYMAARLPVPPHLFKVLVGLVLCASAARLLWSARQTEDAAIDAKPPRAPIAIAVGGAIGALGGGTGTGGGIFLTPLLLFMRWSAGRTAAGISAAFILVNSLAGLLGNTASIAALPARMPLFVVAVVGGGLVGSTVGTQVFGHRALRLALALVLVIAASKLFIR